MIWVKNWKPLVLGLVVLLSYWWVYSKGVEHADTRNQLAWAEHATEDERYANKYAELQESTNKALRLVREESEKDFQSKLDLLYSDRDSLDSTVDSLHKQLAETERKLRKARDTATAGSNESDYKASLVLTKLLGETTEELRRVAGTADEWYLKAAQCNKLYDEIRSH